MDITIQVAVVERTNPIRNLPDLEETIKVLCKNVQARPIAFSKFEDEI